ncbi:MAG: hypothetical protein J0G30_13365 [Actinomycetales bacterium]|nr:hypothetical protein [Actinomycetales bacterium]
MRHDPADAPAAYHHARRPPATGWHPLLAAVEVEPGVWEMHGQHVDRYGVVRLVRRGPEVGYRADLERGGRAHTVGYFRTLRAATAAVHRAWIGGLAPREHRP